MKLKYFVIFAIVPSWLHLKVIILVTQCRSIYQFQFVDHISYWSVVAHPTGRAFTSDWSVNSFEMVVYEKIFSGTLHRKLSRTTIVKPKSVWICSTSVRGCFVINIKQPSWIDRFIAHLSEQLYLVIWYNKLQNHGKKWLCCQLWCLPVSLVRPRF